MLNQETKRRIDSLRDVLVGKVPDPKAQVEQITIALIYKFMNDMDDLSIDFGGEPTFFKGDYKKYAWSNIMSPSNSGLERVHLYMDGIEKMNANPDIPQLFRDIFRGAFLPYRDPETLHLFLKGINDFSYDHSEDLGDAFEYLLSVLGSQGDAGQFRTPRHIIDMIVDIVAPTKNQTILDPACGTAGFLISAYKHILDKNKKDVPGDQLTPDERKNVINNLCGYDISPDMVRLSRVNMYLHGFPDPKIYEYDTLTSEDRWNDSYDVILANPPFMTPKGGIKPHSKFSVKANRSEVLFVDYIAEHLNPNGKAGVIVPEGIIFQSANAYKGLRKFLVENNYLYAVISLPAGVFQPYSGVKTSILLMDRSLAKKTDKILFVKVENDGFDLGAQRREIDKNDIPKVTALVQRYKLALQDRAGFEFNEDEQRYANIIETAKIAENGDYNLSGDRYREGISLTHNIWPMVELSGVCDVRDGTHDSPTYQQEGYPLVTSKNIVNGRIDFSNVNLISKDDLDKINKRSQVDDGDIIMPMIGTIGNPVIVKKDREFAIKNVALIKFYEDSKIDRRYLKFLLDSDILSSHYQNNSSGSTQKFISLGFIRSLKIPLPPLSVQQEIVAELDGYQKVVDGARQVVENYKTRIKVDPSWPLTELQEVCDKITDGTHQTPTYTNEGFVFLSSKNVTSKKIDWDNVKYISEELHNELSKRVSPQLDDVLLAKNGTTGVAAIVDKDIIFDIYVSLALLRPGYSIYPRYLLEIVNADYVKNQFNSRLQGIGVPNLHLKEIKEVKIPLPPIEVQKDIVEGIQKEQGLIETNKELIHVFEKKIKDRIEEVWG